MDERIWGGLVLLGLLAAMAWRLWRPFPQGVEDLMCPRDDE